MLMRAWLRLATRLSAVVLLLLLVALGGWLVFAHYRAEYHIRRATAALQLQRYRLALAEYEEALRYRPRSAPLFLMAARTARQSGDLSTARQYLARCRELQRGVSEEQQLEGYLLRAQAGELDDVHRFLTPYIVKDGPFTPLVLEALVRANMAKFRVQAAREHLSHWLTLEPNSVEALFRRATWYSQQQAVTEGREDFRRVLELDPQRTEVRPAYAELLRADRKFALAAEQFSALLEQKPGDRTAILGLAQCYLDLAKIEEAGRLLDKLPEEEDTAEAKFLRGLLELRRNQPAKAEGFLRDALRRDPGHFDACYNLMLCLRRLGREDDAREMHARFQQIDADQKRLIVLTTQELNAAPTSAKLHGEMGEIYLRLGHPRQAVHWFNLALRLDPGYRTAHERLRDYYDSLGPEGREQAEYHRQQLAAQ
ncbi:MAG: tetratricopeptide repeat protein [Gemmataceae bacterium]